MRAAKQHAQGNVELLADILNRRPAMNHDFATYADWSSEVYNLMGAMSAAPANDAGSAARAQAAPPTLTEQQAHDMGAKGAPATDAERLLFEAWMRGHCWALCATWDGKSYRSDAEHSGYADPRAANTRQLWAAWRDRAALAAQAAPAVLPIGWRPFPAHLQNPDGRLLRTAADLLAREGYTGVAGPLRTMADELLDAAPAVPAAGLDAVLDAFEQKERGKLAAHIAAELVAELRTMLAAAPQPPKEQP